LSYSHVETKKNINGINNKDSKNGASDPSSHDQEYEVEKIIDEDKAGNVEVKWVGYSETSWEPLSSIPKYFYTKFKNSNKVLDLIGRRSATGKLKQVKSQALTNIISRRIKTRNHLRVMIRNIKLKKLLMRTRMAMFK
jgi:hypothetical protein